jgi:hypothetical protein
MPGSVKAMALPERQQLFSALTLLAMALFVSSGYGPLSRWRRGLRLAAIVAFALAVVAALIEIALWLSGRG